MTFTPSRCLSWRVGLSMIVVAVAAVSAGCGSSSSSSKAGGSSTSATPAAAASSTSSSGGGGAVSTARQVVAAATSGFVSSPGLSGPLTPLTSFNGPASSPAPPRDQHIQVVSSCVNPCNFASSIIGTEGAKLGWSYHVATSPDGTPQSYQQLTEAALSQHPSAIVENGTPDLLLGAQIAKARAQHVKIMGLSSRQNTPNGYDGYTAVREDETNRLMADWAVADSGGTAHALYVYPSGFPQYAGYIQSMKQIFAGCAGCKLTTTSAQLGQLAGSSTTVQGLVTAALNADPSINYILWAEDFFQIGAGQQAALTGGHHPKMIASGGSTIGIALIKQGVLAADAGTPVQWIGYAGYDNLRRILAGKKPIGANDWGGGAHLWTKANIPAGAPSNQTMSDALDKLIDYRGAYEKLWSH